MVFDVLHPCWVQYELGKRFLTEVCLINSEICLAFHHTSVE